MSETLPIHRGTGRWGGPRLVSGAMMAALTLSLAGCGWGSNTTPVHSDAGPSAHAPAPPPHEPVLSGSDTEAARGDLDFWNAYAGGDVSGACSSLYGLKDGSLVRFTDSLLQSCEDAFSGSSTDGTSVSVSQASAYGPVAIVNLRGSVCGSESPNGPECADIPDVSSFMPTDDSPAAFLAALGTILRTSLAQQSRWMPDVLVNDNGKWHLLITLPSGGSSDPNPAPSSGGDNGQDKPWNNDDWNETCASGGCGIPGLPPFVPGGGLSFGSSG